MAEKVVDNKIYYELRWIDINETSGFNEYHHYKCNSLDDAWHYYKHLIQPSIDFYKNHNISEGFKYLGCFRIHQLEEIDFSNYSDTITRN